ncbi:MAG TPA: hypothetical protein VFR97_08750 [Capillimicrobium sp.]|nr:hypothetical protein [Capillimicrobium sp.]
MQRFRTIALILSSSAALAAAPGVAIAQESAGDAYGGQGEVAASVSTPNQGGGGTAPTAGASAGATQEVSSGELPFTGFDAALVAVGGILLVALGLGVRRLSRDQAARA